MESVTEASICTQYSCFENMGRFVTLKKIRSKKQGHCYSKRGEARLPLHFLNNNDPGFCTPYFGPDPKEISGPPHILDNRVQIDWSSKI